MKFKFVFSTFILSMISACSSPTKSMASAENNAFSSHHLIIFYDTQIGAKPLYEAIKQYHAELIYDYQTLKGVAIRIPANKTLEEATTYFEKVNGVLAVNPDQIHSLD